MTEVRRLSTEEINALECACIDDFMGLRMRVFLYLALRVGLSESEIHDLNLAHVTTSAGVPSLQIQIPGDGVVSVGADWTSLLDRFLEARRDFFNGSSMDAKAPLIISGVTTRLTRKAGRKAMIQIAEDAGVGGVSFHALRATFIHSVWLETKDHGEVARRCRIRSPTTLLRHIS